MHPEEIRRLIERGLVGSRVEVSGDGRHFEAVVVYQGFTGKGRIAQHRMVYAALGDSFATDTLHALALRTFTPDQWERAGAG